MFFSFRSETHNWCIDEHRARPALSSSFALADKRRFSIAFFTSDGSISHFLPQRICFIYRPYPLSPAVFHREKRVAADNPLLPCLILIAFTGSRLDQYTPPASCYLSVSLFLSLPPSRALSLSVASLRSTNLNYPEGCFDARIPAVRAFSPIISLFLSFLLLLRLLHILRAPV